MLMFLFTVMFFLCVTRLCVLDRLFYGVLRFRLNCIILFVLSYREVEIVLGVCVWL